MIQDSNLISKDSSAKDANPISESDLTREENEMFLRSPRAAVCARRKGWNGWLREDARRRDAVLSLIFSQGKEEGLSWRTRESGAAGLPPSCPFGDDQ